MRKVIEIHCNFCNFDSTSLFKLNYVDSVDEGLKEVSA